MARNAPVTRLATVADVAAIAAMRHALWPYGSVDEFRDEVERILAGTFSPLPYAIIIADAGDTIVGFAEVSLRSHADGCETHPVGYLEGLFVHEAHRGSGVARALVAAAENWVRANGCTEMGSDALIDNDASHRMHAALGYDVVDRCVNYRKDL